MTGKRVVECAPPPTAMEPETEVSLRLLERARSGDPAALDALLLRYLPRLRRWAAGRLPVAARAELDTDDVVQETMVNAVRHLHRIEIQDAGALQAYLRQALSNRLIDAYRRAGRKAPQVEMDSGLPAENTSPLEAAIGSEALARYEAGLRQLKSEDRQAVILRVELCYPYDEIAAMLGKSNAAAARVAVSRALARLARAMRA